MIKFDFSNPEEWTLIGMVYLYSPSSEEGGEIVEQIFDDIADMNGVPMINNLEVYDYCRSKDIATEGSRFWERSTCDHCGSHFHYGAAYRSTRGEVAVVGNVCASHALTLDTDKYADRTLRALAKSRRTRIKNREIRERNEKLLEGSFKDENPKLYEAMHIPHNYVASDIMVYFLRNGTVTEKQTELLLKMLDQHHERLAKEARLPDPAPVPDTDDRIEITGEVLGLRQDETPYGLTTKMLVIDDRGFKLWGTLPSSLWEAEKGSRVSFVARIEASEKDETFGFFQRPTKGVVLEQGAAS